MSVLSLLSFSLPVQTSRYDLLILFFNVFGICPFSCPSSCHCHVPLNYLISFLPGLLFSCLFSPPPPFNPILWFFFFSIKPQMRSCCPSAYNPALPWPFHPHSSPLPITWSPSFWPQLLPLAPGSHPWTTCHVRDMLFPSWLGVSAHAPSSA